MGRGRTSDISRQGVETHRPDSEHELQARNARPLAYERHVRLVLKIVAIAMIIRRPSSAATLLPVANGSRHSTLPKGQGPRCAHENMKRPQGAEGIAD
ncbi:hypothetical protein OH77DRAFT_834959 [Trametes cingulata]|nr:hypothetical protein OH77DRAFT_834959 [Trametes cingulata]